MAPIIMRSSATCWGYEENLKRLLIYNIFATEVPLLNQRPSWFAEHASHQLPSSDSENRKKSITQLQSHYYQFLIGQ